MENTQKIFTIKGIYNEAFEIIKPKFWKVVSQFAVIFLVYLVLSVAFRNIWVLRTASMVLYMFAVAVYSLSYIEKGSFSFDDFIHSLTLKKFCYFFATAFLFALAVIGGMVLLIVPGIMFAIMMGFYKYIVLKKEISPVDAIKESMKITKGYRWNIFWFSLVSGLLIVLGMLCFIVGSFITIPLVMIADALIYKKLSAHAVPAKPEEVVSEEPKDSISVEATSV